MCVWGEGVAKVMSAEAPSCWHMERVDHMR